MAAGLAGAEFLRGGDDFGGRRAKKGVKEGFRGFRRQQASRPASKPVFSNEARIDSTTCFYALFRTLGFLHCRARGVQGCGNRTGFEMFRRPFRVAQQRVMGDVAETDANEGKCVVADVAARHGGAEREVMAVLSRDQMVVAV